MKIKKLIAVIGAALTIFVAQAQEPQVVRPPVARQENIPGLIFDWSDHELRGEQAKSTEIVNIDPTIQLDLVAGVCSGVKGGVADRQYNESVQGYWGGTVAESLTLNPHAFRAVTTGIWQYLVINDTDTPFFMWLGQEGGTNQGNWLVFPWRAKSPQRKISLSNFRITVRSYPANDFRQVLTFGQYFDEHRGIRADQTEDRSGLATVSYPEFRSLGARSAFRATSATGVRDIANYAPSNIKGIVCTLDVVENGVVIARKELVIPFEEISPATLVMLDKMSLLLKGDPNKQYRLQWTASLSPANWQFLGGGEFVSPGKIPVTWDPSGTSTKFYRVQIP